MTLGFVYRWQMRGKRVFVCVCVCRVCLSQSPFNSFYFTHLWAHRSVPGSLWLFFPPLFPSRHPPSLIPHPPLTSPLITTFLRRLPLFLVPPPPPPLYFLACAMTPLSGHTRLLRPRHWIEKQTQPDECVKVTLTICKLQEGWVAPSVH